MLIGSYGRHHHTGIIISVALAVTYCLQHCTFSFLDILYLSHQEKIEQLHWPQRVAVEHVVDGTAAPPSA